EREVEFTKTCPSCGSELHKLESEVAIRCISPDCPAQLVEKVRHFCGRDAMDIEGVGDVIVQQLVDSGLVKNVADLYRLEVATLAELERLAEKSAQNIVDGLERSKSRPLHAFLFALGIRHV